MQASQYYRRLDAAGNETLFQVPVAIFAVTLAGIVTPRARANTQPDLASVVPDRVEGGGVWARSMA